MDTSISIPSVRREKAYLRIVDIIINLISEGKVAYKDKFYTEQELMSILGVSRPTLREALRVLEFLGVTTVSPRNGISINAPNDSDGYLPLLYTLAFEKTTPQELFEIRQALQLEMVAIAALERTPEMIAALKSINDKMRHNLDASPEEFAAIDFLFHQQIIMTSKNHLALKLSNTIAPLIQSQLEMRQRVSSGKTREKTLIEHENIVSLIESGSSEEARNCMLKHMEASALMARNLGNEAIRFSIR